MVENFDGDGDEEEEEDEDKNYEDMSYLKEDYEDYGDEFDGFHDDIYDVPGPPKPNMDSDVSSVKKKREQGFLSQDANGAPSDNEDGSKLKIKFQSKVQHHVTAVVTWPDPCVSGENAEAPEVVGYIFRFYESSEDHHITNPVSLNLAQNFITLDKLEPNANYGYQVKYIYDNNTESQWSEEEMLDTNVDQHEQ